MTQYNERDMLVQQAFRNNDPDDVSIKSNVNYVRFNPVLMSGYNRYLIELILEWWSCEMSQISI